MKFIDRTGSRFGRWLVICFDSRNSSGSASWVCQCDCGSISKVSGSNLTSGTSSSCGCWKKEQAVTHGMTDHPAYHAFNTAKHRCTNKKNKQYEDYGGRGIRFLFNNFEEFWEEVKGSYSEGLTLERIKNDGNYEPGNVRWASRLEQAKNKRNNLWIEYGGQRRIQSEWARYFGVTDQVIAGRLKTATVEQVFFNLEREMKDE